jgi:hypothetical protein
MCSCTFYVSVFIVLLVPFDRARDDRSSVGECLNGPWVVCCKGT